MTASLKKKDTDESFIGKADQIRKEQFDACRKRLEECMAAPKLKQTLLNGYYEKNKDLLAKLREEQGRKRNIQHYFHNPYKQ